MSETTTALFPKIIPILAEYLDSRTILNCRGVTREAKRMTEDILKENLGFWGEAEPITTKLTLQQQIMRVRNYTFGDLESCKNFTDYMEKRPFPDENPFITGSIRIELWWHISSHLHRKRFQLFLSMFGKHVRSLRLTYVRSLRLLEGALDKTVQTLQLLLPHLPNLESLKFESRFRAGPVEELTVLILPHLNGLKKLYLHPKSAILKAEVKLALKLLNKYKWSLEAVSVGGLFLESKTATVSELFNNIPFIKRLQVQGINYPTGLQKLTDVEWELEELQLVTVYFYPDSSEAISSLLNAIGSFAATLRTLKLLLWGKDYLANLLTPDDLKAMEMKTMCVLKQITVDFACLGRGWFMKFLEVSCGKLEELTLFQYENTWLAYDVRVTVLKVEYAQKVFEILPNLKKIILLTKSNTKTTLYRHDITISSIS